MRKTVLLLVVVSVTLTFAVSQAFARPAPPDHPGAVKIQLEQTADAQGTEAGFAVINEDDEGNYQVTIHIYGMDPGQWVAWGVGTGDRVAEVQCNRRGIATDHVRVNTIGDAVNIKTIDAPGAQDGDVVLVGTIPQ